MGQGLEYLGGGQGLEYWGRQGVANDQQAHDVVTTSYCRRCDVTTSHRRHFDVKCAH